MNILMRHVRYNARKMLETIQYNISDEMTSRYEKLWEDLDTYYGPIAEATDEQLDASLKDAVQVWLIIVPISWAIRFICGIGNLFHWGEN